MIDQKHRADQPSTVHRPRFERSAQRAGSGQSLRAAATRHARGQIDPTRRRRQPEISRPTGDLLRPLIFLGSTTVHGLGFQALRGCLPGAWRLPSRAWGLWTRALVDLAGWPAACFQGHRRVGSPIAGSMCQKYGVASYPVPRRLEIALSTLSFHPRRSLLLRETAATTNHVFVVSQNNLFLPRWVVLCVL